MRKLRLKNELECAMFYGPVLIIFIMLTCMSSILVFFYSVTDWTGMTKGFNFIGINNYIDMLKDDVLGISLINSLKFVLILPLLTVIPTLILAVLINNMTRGSNFVKSGFFLPTVLNTTAVTFIWMYMYKPNIGVINTILRMVGLESLQPDWLGDLNIVLFSITVIAIWQGVGVSMMLFLAALKSVPKELMEAAEIDGAGNARKLINVTIPMIRPTFNVVTLLSISGALRIFGPIYVATDGGPGHLTYTMVIYIFKIAMQQNGIGYGSAISVLFFILVLILSLIPFKLMAKKETEQ